MLEVVDWPGRRRESCIAGGVLGSHGWGVFVFHSDADADVVCVESSGPILSSYHSRFVCEHFKYQPSLVGVTFFTSVCFTRNSEYDSNCGLT